MHADAEARLVIFRHMLRKRQEGIRGKGISWNCGIIERFALERIFSLVILDMQVQEVFAVISVQVEIVIIGKFKKAVVLPYTRR